MNSKIVPWHRLASKICRENEKRRMKKLQFDIFKAQEKENPTESPKIEAPVTYDKTTSEK